MATDYQRKKRLREARAALMELLRGPDLLRPKLKSQVNKGVSMWEVTDAHHKALQTAWAEFEDAFIDCHLRAHRRQTDKEAA